MSAAAAASFGRLVFGNLRAVLSRSSVYHASIRNFYLQPACEAVMKIEMPSLSPTMEKGTIIKWHKKEGDAVSPGDVLCDIQTDKAVVSMEYDDEGVLAKILKPDNSKDIKVGELIALMVNEGEDWTDVQVPAVTSAPPTPAAAAATAASPAAAAPSPATPVEAVVIDDDIPGVGPSVKKLLHEYNITPSSVSGSGPKGNLTKGDVLSFIAAKGLHKVDQAHLSPAQAATPQAAPPLPSSSPAVSVAPGQGEPYVDIPLSNMRKVIAKRLTESKTTIPHAYATIDCSMKTITNTRKRFIAQGSKVSMNDFIIKAAGFALERSPKVNATYQQETAQTMASVDISVAVATEGGLITPIVQNVPAMGVVEISQKVKELAEKARAGKLQPHEFQGGSFSISNLGMFGIKEFSAVINPPQVAILAIGTTRLTVGNENAIVDPKMAVTLSYDSRVMDEGDATRFLELFRLALENPDILVGGELSARNADLAFGTAV